MTDEFDFEKFVLACCVYVMTLLDFALRVYLAAAILRNLGALE